MELNFKIFCVAIFYLEETSNTGFWELYISFLDAP